jgi:hypothetical protein
MDELKRIVALPAHEHPFELRLDLSGDPRFDLRELVWCMLRLRSVHVMVIKLHDDEAIEHPGPRPPFEFALDRKRWQKLDQTLWAKSNGVHVASARPEETALARKRKL